MNSQLKNFFHSFFSILPFFGIFFTYSNLLLGPNGGSQIYLSFVTLLLLVLVLGRAVFISPNFVIKQTDGLWLCFALFILCNCLFSQTGGSFFQLQGLFLSVGLYIFFKSQVKNLTTISKEVVSLFFALLGIVVSSYALLQYVEIFPPHSGYFAVTSFFVNPGPMAMFLAVVAPFMALPLLEADRRQWGWKEAGIFIALTASLAIIYLSYSRTAWVAVGVMSVVYFFVFKRNEALKIWHWTGLAAVFILAIGLLYFIKPESAQGRILNYLVSFNVWKEHPIFGVGWNDFSYYYNQFQASYFQHYPMSSFSRLADDMGVYYNEFIRMAVELGLVGFILLVVSLFFSLNINRLKEAPVLVKSAWLSTIGILVAGLFSYPLSQIFTQTLFLFDIAILACYDERIFLSIKGVKVKIIAGGMIIVSLVLLYHDITAFRASQQWEKAFDRISENRPEGLKIYKEVYPRLKAYSTFLYNYGYELSMAEQYPKSLNMLQKAEHNMYNEDLLLRKGYVLEELERYNEAEHYYLQARYLVPSRLVPRYLLMKLYERQFKKKRTQKMAHQLIEMKPKADSEKALFLKNEAQIYLNNHSNETEK